ncbi:MAG: hypothetical protein ACLQLC_14725 [Candidatus Sulfotelmatobacter sp.]
MEALNIAFDIIIAGALALPWVLLVIHLFFSNDEHNLKKLMDWVKAQQQPALAGVLLFAMTYALGSAVSRIAQDFYDDDDLHVHIFHRLFRIGVTESSVRTLVFCSTLHETEAPGDLAKVKPEPPKTMEAKPADASTGKQDSLERQSPDCKFAGMWTIPTYDPYTNQRITFTDPVSHQPISAAAWINNQEDLAADIFRVHEAAVLLKGTDSTERVREYQHQIMVLRAAAFNGLLAFALYLFWWSAQFHPSLGWTASLGFALMGFIALGHHLSQTPLTDPPYMEFTLLVLAAAGWYIPWKHRSQEKRGPKPAGHSGRKLVPFAYLALAAFLTVTASLGWWATQVLYDQQIIYSYEAMYQRSTSPATPSQK